MTAETPPEAPTFPLGRRRARELALQALFELEMTDHSLEAVLDDRLAEVLEEGSLPATHLEFARALAGGAWAHRAAADELVATAAPRWQPHQMPLVDRTILRLAIFEMCFDNGTPPRVAINEAVELAKAYGGEHSSRFVNGVLGAIAAQRGRGEGVHGRVDI